MVFVMTPPANASYGTSHAARAPRTTASFTAMSPERVAQNLHLDVLDVHVQVVAGQRLRLRVARKSEARRHAEKAGGDDDADDAHEDENAAAAIGCRGDGEGGEHSSERQQPAGAATKRLEVHILAHGFFAGVAEDEVDLGTREVAELLTHALPGSRLRTPQPRSCLPMRRGWGFGTATLWSVVTVGEHLEKSMRSSVAPGSGAVYG